MGFFIAGTTALRPSIIVKIRKSPKALFLSGWHFHIPLWRWYCQQQYEYEFMMCISSMTVSNFVWNDFFKIIIINYRYVISSIRENNTLYHPSNRPIKHKHARINVGLRVIEHRDFLCRHLFRFHFSRIAGCANSRYLPTIMSMFREHCVISESEIWPNCVVHLIPKINGDGIGSSFFGLL